MLAITVVAGPLYDLAERAARDIADPDVYVTAVLSPGSSSGAEPAVAGGAR
jgi:hypothetical protein